MKKEIGLGLAAVLLSTTLFTGCAEKKKPAPVQEPVVTQPVEKPKPAPTALELALVNGYTVKSGESAEDIGKKLYGYTQMGYAVLDWNPEEVDGLHVKKGTRLKVYQVKGYEVKPGETWESIAQKYDISVKELKKANSWNEDKLSPGNVYYIPIKE